MSSAPTSATLHVITTADRRFYQGARVIIGRRKHTPAGVGPECDAFETAVISSITATTIVLMGAPAGSYGRGDLVWPCIEVEVSVQNQSTSSTDRMLEVQLSCSEVPGSSALPPWQTADDLPLAYATFFGYPVLEPAAYADPDKRPVGWARDIRSNPVGLGAIYELAGPRPKSAWSYSFYAYQRASSVSIMRFFDAVSGPLLPFIGISPLHPFDVLSVGASSITVSAAGPLGDWAGFPLLAVKSFGTNAAQLTRIQSVARVGSVDTLTLGDTITPVALADLRWVAPAALVRFDDQELHEVWQTTEHATIALTATELPAVTSVFGDSPAFAELIVMPDSPPPDVGCTPGVGCPPVIAIRLNWPGVIGFVTAGTYGSIPWLAPSYYFSGDVGFNYDGQTAYLFLTPDIHTPYSTWVGILGQYQFTMVWDTIGSPPGCADIWAIDISQIAAGGGSQFGITRSVSCPPISNWAMIFGSDPSFTIDVL